MDASGFLKKGQASCGVGRQYTGSAGKITNCQIGVSGAYVSERGHAFIDRALYLPKNWTSKPERLKQAHVPDEVVFASKPALASMMVERSIEAGVPFRWVTADRVYGVGDVERTLRRAGIGYVPGVRDNHWFGSWATEHLMAGETKDIAAELSDQAWHRMSARHGTKGERLYDWTYLPLALHRDKIPDITQTKPFMKNIYPDAFLAGKAYDADRLNYRLIQCGITLGHLIKMQ